MAQLKKSSANEPKSNSVVKDQNNKLSAIEEHKNAEALFMNAYVDNMQLQFGIGHCLRSNFVSKISAEKLDQLIMAFSQNNFPILSRDPINEIQIVKVAKSIRFFGHNVRQFMKAMHMKRDCDEMRDMVQNVLRPAASIDLN